MPGGFPAKMIEAAEVKPGDRVFEGGSGSGYAAAVLSRIAARVYRIERYGSHNLSSGPVGPKTGSMRGRATLCTAFTARSCSSTVRPHSS